MLFENIWLQSKVRDRKFFSTLHIFSLFVFFRSQQSISQDSMFQLSLLSVEMVLLEMIFFAAHKSQFFK